VEEGVAGRTTTARRGNCPPQWGKIKKKIGSYYLNVNERSHPTTTAPYLFLFFQDLKNKRFSLVVFNH
jgi:hypothetical protein